MRMWFQGESGLSLMRKASSRCRLWRRVRESQKVRSRKTKSKMNEPVREEGEGGEGVIGRGQERAKWWRERGRGEREQEQGSLGQRNPRSGPQGPSLSQSLWAEPGVMAGAHMGEGLSRACLGGSTWPAPGKPPEEPRGGERGLVTKSPRAFL